MIALFFSVLARAEPVALWEGLPAERLAALDLGAPVHGPPTDGVPGGALRYALHPGHLEGAGLLVLYITPSIADAERVFDGLTKTGATHWEAPVVPTVGQRMLGDGQQVALARLDNVVVLVRDPVGAAALVVQAVKRELPRD